MNIDYRLGRSPEVLDDLPNSSVDLIIADPPYGLGTGDHQYGRRTRWGVEHGHQFIQNDEDLSQLALFGPSVRRLLKPEGLAIIFCAPSKRREAIRLVEYSDLAVFETIPWDKGAPGISHRVRWCFEDMLFVTPDPGIDQWLEREPLIAPLRVPRVRNTEHPNQKPVWLYRKLIQWAFPAGGITVVDPFAGVASCGVAAIAEKCGYFGVESDEQWIPIGQRRLAEGQAKRHPDIKQNDLFTEEPAA